MSVSNGAEDLATLLKLRLGSPPPLSGPFGLSLCGLAMWFIAGAFLVGAFAAVATAATNNPDESEHRYLEKSEFDSSAGYDIPFSQIFE